MRCDCRILLLLLNAFAIVVNVFCNVTEKEPHGREKRQDRRDFGEFSGQEGGGGPWNRNIDGVVPDNGHQTPLSLTQSLASNPRDFSTSDINPMKTKTRFARFLPILGSGRQPGAGKKSNPDEIGLLPGSRNNKPSLLNLGSSQVNPAFVNILGNQSEGNEGGNSRSTCRNDTSLLNLGGSQQDPALINVFGNQTGGNACGNNTSLVNFGGTQQDPAIINILGKQTTGNQRRNENTCREDQFTCKSQGCVGRDMRCNGVHDCEDGSDELYCTALRNTKAPPHGSLVTKSPTSGCLLPRQPTGGSFVLGGCEQSCNIEAGTRVPVDVHLVYTCNEGYTMKGNNVSFCHNGTWYMPPTCGKSCPALKSNSVDIECKYRGEIVSCETTIAPGTKATLACKNSFSLPPTADPAYRELNCLTEGIWDRTLFRCLPDCGTAISHGNTLIVNGFTAKLGVFPWHVGVYRKGPDGKYQQICGGTLISPDLVISAAHCFYDDTVNAVSDASYYAVAAGKHYRAWVMPEKYAQTSPVKKIDVAARYNGARGNFAEDISLVRLEKPFTLTTLVRPICMDWDNIHEREQLQSKQSGKAVGWGKTAAGEPSNELQEINLPYIPYQECISAVPEEFKGYITADKFCAGYLNGSSLCEGDSGGGLCFQLNGLWYLRGVVSVSPVSQNTCDNNYYTAFTNVGRFGEWIRAAYVGADLSKYV